MLIERPPRIFRMLFPKDCFFRSRVDYEKRAYLTFDDGPIPEVTPYVLDILDRFGVKATFFAVGDNARRYPDLISEIRHRGHTLGNHTMHHLRGTSASVSEYISDVTEASQYIGPTRLFRPPHGWLTWRQAKALMENHIIVLYDLVTRDYARKVSAEDILRNVQRFARDGSIIVFHDSLKSAGKLHFALPQAIRWLQDSGYRLRPIPDCGEVPYNTERDGEI